MNKKFFLWSFCSILLLTQCDPTTPEQSNPKNQVQQVQVEHPQKNVVRKKNLNSSNEKNKPESFISYTDGKRASIESFQEYLWTKLRFNEFPEFVLDALVYEELTRQNKYPTSQEVQSLLKNYSDQLKKNRSFLKELKERQMSLDVYLKLMFPRQKYSTARQRMYQILCEENKEEPETKPNLSWMRQQLEKKHSITFTFQNSPSLFKIGETVYSEGSLKNYLFGQHYLNEMLNFAFYELAKRYFEENNLSYRAENFDQVKNSLKKQMLHRINSEHKEEFHLWLAKHGMTPEIFESNLQKLTEQKIIIFTTAEKIKDTDQVLKPYFYSRYTSAYEKDGTLYGRNMVLYRYSINKIIATRLLYPEEKFKEELPHFIQEKTALLNQIRQDILDQKITFTQAVGLHSEDTTSMIKKGGEVGLVDAYNWPRSYFNAVQKLQINEISEPIQTEQGLYLIQVDEIIPEALIVARHLFLTPQWSESETSSVPQITEEMVEKQAQEAWEQIQKSSNPEETFLTLIREKNIKEEGIFGPIARERVYKSYLKQFENGKIKEIQPPFKTISGIYIIQPLEIISGRKCRHLYISAEYSKRFAQFSKKESSSKIEAKTQEILQYLAKHTPEETASEYQEWLQLAQTEYFPYRMEPGLEVQIPHLKKGDISKPFWFKEDYVFYQVIDLQEVIYNNIKEQLAQDLINSGEDPGLRTGPALAQIYPYQLNFVFPYQDRLVLKSE